MGNTESQAARRTRAHPRFTTFPPSPAISRGAGLEHPSRAVTRNHAKIAYSKLAKHLGVANQSVGLYLDAIYKDEIAAGRPDLTLVVVYSETG